MYLGHKDIYVDRNMQQKSSGNKNLGQRVVQNFRLYDSTTGHLCFKISIHVWF